MKRSDTDAGRSQRLTLAAICIFATVAAAQQKVPKKPNLRPIVTHYVGPVTQTVPPPPPKMPDVRWLDFRKAEITIRELVHRVAQPVGDPQELVIAQNPDPGLDMSPNTPLTITLGRPKLSLIAPLAAKTNEPVKVVFTFAPPPPSLPIEYHVAWGEGPEETVTTPSAKHVFAKERTYSVSAYAVIAGRWKADPGSATIAVAAPPVTVTETTQTSQRSRLRRPSRNLRATRRLFRGPHPARRRGSRRHRIGCASLQGAEAARRTGQRAIDLDTPRPREQYAHHRARRAASSRMERPAPQRHPLGEYPRKRSRWLIRISP